MKVGIEPNSWRHSRGSWMFPSAIADIWGKFMPPEAMCGLLLGHIIEVDYMRYRDTASRVSVICL